MTRAETIEYIKTNCYGEWCKDDWRNAMDMAIEALKMIDESKTADVVEAVHAEWVDKGEDYVLRWSCSNCGRKDTHIYNFCPDCGADMRGSTDEI